MTVLNQYDFLVIVVYMAILVGVGLYFMKYMKGAADYFKAANRLTWWVAGLSSFMSAFSVWTFTGGAGIVYREGLSGAVVLVVPGFAIFSGYFLFARLWRRSRVTTIMEYLEERFNLPTHQIISWSYIPVYILYSAAALFSLGIFISTALGLDIHMVIWISGIVILIYTLLGGVWAISVNDTIQFMVLLPVCILLVPLSLNAIGGFEGLVQQAPENYFSFPSEGLPWHFHVIYILLLIHGLNTNPIAQRYFSVRNEKEANKVSLLCASLFFVGILFWAVPPMVARILFPDLGSMLALPNPDEGAFVVIALHLLPHGLIGLLIAAMFAAALSSIDSTYNMLAAILSKDIFQRVFKQSMSDKALLRVGQITTLIIGVIVTGLSLSMVKYGEGAFSVMMKISSLTLTPLATPMLLGFIYRKAPGWACLFSFVCSAITALIFAFYTPLIQHLQSLGPKVEFSVSSITIIVVAATSFFISFLLFKETDEEKARINQFFTKLKTPVDESTEIQDAEIDRTSIVSFIGKIALILGMIVVPLALIPASTADRLINLGMGCVFLGTGVWLCLVGRPKKIVQ